MPICNGYELQIALQIAIVTLMRHFVRHHLRAVAPFCAG